MRDKYGSIAPQRVEDRLNKKNIYLLTDNLSIRMYRREISNRRDNISINICTHFLTHYETTVTYNYSFRSEFMINYEENE